MVDAAVDTERRGRANGNGAAPHAGRAWDQMLTRTARGNPHCTVHNINVEITHDPAWLDVFYYCELRQQLMLKRPVPDHTAGACWAGLPRPWRDTDTTAALRWFEQGDYPHIGIHKVELAINECASRDHRVHEIRNYLDGLQWDGKLRIGRWLGYYCGAEADTDELREFIEAVGKKWLVAAVARIYQPGCKADHVLVLEGPQGVGKTSTFAILAGAWFSENLPSELGSKDAAGHLRGRWIIELSELGQLRNSEIETVKNYITRTTERFRPPYGRHDVDFPRQCVFGGSTNAGTYLKDETGGRRFWPVKVGQCDLESLRADRDQLWAEAKHFYQNGELWWLTDERVIATAAEEQSARREQDPWEEKVMKYLAGKTEVKSIGEILTNVLDIEPKMQGRREQKRMSDILLNCGWERGKRLSSAYPWVKRNQNPMSDMGDI